MDREQVLRTLDEYAEELGRILGRFTKTSDGLHIASKDGYRMREISAELVDFINDHIPNSMHHSTMVADYYNHGINNWSGSSSYASVEEIKGVVKSLKTRIERNPSLFESVTGEITVGSEEKKRFDGIEVIANRFHAVVMQLRQRYHNRKTLDVNDE